ncbi:MAG: 50S ribosomal protein L19 [Chloroflexota bacterium]|nr:50S ribosomal protein L19 [Chloroflexota bacterium]
MKVNPKVQSFSPGDTVRVGMRIKEGERERVQAFQGVVIKTGGRPPATSFTVRRVTYGVGVERIFRLYSPLLVGVEVLRRGDVRRANLTYLRSLFGKAARIREKAWTGVAVAKGVAEEPAQEEQPAAASAEQPAPAAEAASAPVAAAEAPAQKPQDKPAAQ